MGMHMGFVAATCSVAQLLAELSRHTGDFTVGETVANTADAAHGRVGEEWALVLGGSESTSFLLDSSMMISTNGDLLQLVSARLGLVVGAGAETVSGTCWLTAARGGHLLRHAFASTSALEIGMELGEPLPSEADCPINQPDGDGVFPAMASLGLDPRPWLLSGPAQQVRYTGLREAPEGQLATIAAEHWAKHSLTHAPSRR